MGPAIASDSAAGRLSVLASKLALPGTGPVEYAPVGLRRGQAGLLRLYAASNSLCAAFRPFPPMGRLNVNVFFV